MRELEGIVVKRTAKSRLIVALALALVLVAQSVVGAFAVGTVPQLDAFGNPLCLNGPDHDGNGPDYNGSGGNTGDHSKIPSCCTFACSMFWPGIAAPADAGRIAAGQLVAIRVAFTNPKAIDLNQQGYRPGNPRAPPQAA